MNNQPATTTTTAISLLPESFQAPDLRGLYGTINVLAGKGRQLSEDEKKTVLETISNWEYTTLSRINLKCDSAKEYLDLLAFDHNNYFTVKKDVLRQLCDNTGLSMLYDDLELALEKLMDFQAQPLILPERLDTVKKQHDYDLMKQTWRIKMEQLECQVNRSIKKVITELNRKPEIISLIKSLKKYLKNKKKMEAEIKNISQKATINISIDSDEMRNLIQELMDFTRKI